MGRRFVSIWLYELSTDWFSIKKPALRSVPFVVAAKDHGRMVITAVNNAARKHGITPGMVLADARVIIPTLEVTDDVPGLNKKLLKRLAAWCIRFTPIACIDEPDGLLLDVTGCSHLWQGDEPYLKDIIKRLNALGFHVRTGLADTIGAAWAVARYAHSSPVVESGAHTSTLLSLPPIALRIEPNTTEQLYKLGLHQIQDLTTMQRPALRRRFGTAFLKRLDQFMGQEEEFIEPEIPPAPFEERLPVLEPIITSTGIEMALQQLMQTLCTRLQKEGKGIRTATFKCYCLEGNIIEVQIGTIRPSVNVNHLFKLFELKLDHLKPDYGIELFVLEANKVEETTPIQLTVTKNNAGLRAAEIGELLDRLSSKLSPNAIRRYLPDEHYWPERSFKLAESLTETPTTHWVTNKPRPLQLLAQPEPVQVMAPVPDYPPMNFRHKGQLHKIVKADGPERIEQEWWLQQGQHRDYYYVEDEEGQRFWIFRLGHYDANKTYGWFLHGFFS